jgi:hypothetical protein
MSDQLRITRRAALPGGVAFAGGAGVDAFRPLAEGGCPLVHS